MGQLNQGAWAEDVSRVNTGTEGRSTMAGTQVNSEGTWANNASPAGSAQVNNASPAGNAWANNTSPAGGVWVDNINSAAGAGMANTWTQNPNPGMRPLAAVPAGKADTEETKRFKENYGFFAPAAFFYAVFYAFCMYRNGSGITFPFFVGGGLLFLCCSLPKLGLTLKKGSIFYMTASVLLGISTFCTDDARIIAFNKLGIFLLIMSLLLKQFFDTSKWKLGKYMGSILVMTFACVGEIGRPFSDGKLYRKNNFSKNSKRLWAVVIGFIIAVPLFFVVLMLLASADAVFRQIVYKPLENISFADIISVIFQIAFIFFASYSLLSYLCSRTLREEVTDRRTGEPVMAITVTGLLTLLYLFFSGIQIGGLFLNKLQLPEDYTYAMYAREGFFQLLAVGFINLLIVLVCMGYFRESKLLKAVLTVMSLCTFVMIASSVMRMIIYIHYYYMTFDRLLALWGLALLTFLFVGIVINIFKEDFPLFRYSVAVVTVLYLLLSFAKPDYIIAKVNISNAVHEGYEATEYTDRKPYSDYAYLSRLSADAAPVMVPFLQELGYNMEAYRTNDPVEYMKAMDPDEDDNYKRYTLEGFGYYWMRSMKSRVQGMGFRSFNLSRYIVLKALTGR